MSTKFTQEDLNKVLDNLHEGIIGYRKDYQWDMSNNAFDRNKARIGKKLSEETKRILSEEKKGKRPAVLENKEALKRRVENHYKPVLVYDKKGNFIERFNSVNDCKVKHQNAYYVLKGKWKQAGGYIFKYENNE